MYARILWRHCCIVTGTTKHSGTSDNTQPVRGKTGLKRTTFQPLLKLLIMNSYIERLSIFWKQYRSGTEAQLLYQHQCDTQPSVPVGFSSQCFEIYESEWTSTKISKNWSQMSSPVNSEILDLYTSSWRPQPLKFVRPWHSLCKEKKYTVLHKFIQYSLNRSCVNKTFHYKLYQVLLTILTKRTINSLA